MHARCLHIRGDHSTDRQLQQRASSEYRCHCYGMEINTDHAVPVQVLSAQTEPCQQICNGQHLTSACSVDKIHNAGYQQLMQQQVLQVQQLAAARRSCQMNPHKLRIDPSCSTCGCWIKAGHTTSRGYRVGTHSQQPGMHCSTRLLKGSTADC